MCDHGPSSSPPYGGLVCRTVKFLPKYATVVQPLRQLLRTNTQAEFQWTAAAAVPQWKRKPSPLFGSHSELITDLVTEIAQISPLLTALPLTGFEAECEDCNTSSHSFVHWVCKSWQVGKGGRQFSGPLTVQQQTGMSYFILSEKKECSTLITLSGGISGGTTGCCRRGNHSPTEAKTVLHRVRKPPAWTKDYVIKQMEQLYFISFMTVFPAVFMFCRETQLKHWCTYLKRPKVNRLNSWRVNQWLFNKWKFDACISALWEQGMILEI